MMCLQAIGVTAASRRRITGKIPVPLQLSPASNSYPAPGTDMTERYIHHLRVERPVAAESATEARERLRDKFPRTALRRMTHLGLLLGSTLEGVALGPDDALVYASSFAETRALEDFLASFPAASPLLFQTSIHPGGIQQVLIGRQQPIARLWPLAGHARLVEQALLTAVLEPAPRVIVAGGEERGTWLLEQGMASERAFAFALELTSTPGNATGRVSFHGIARAAPGSTPDMSEPPALSVFVDALADRRGLTWCGNGGTWVVEFRQT
jgi:hypothetical protein